MTTQGALGAEGIDLTGKMPRVRVEGENPSAIGIFDSGFGGLTVANAISQALPHESILYFGDTMRCPYGPREQSEVCGFVRQICSWFERRDVKLIVIACNTATAAGLAQAQREFATPVLGVIAPGARAAVAVTRSRKVGVIGTQSTIRSGAYVSAIHALDAGIEVIAAETPMFVEIVESGWRLEDPKSAGRERLNPQIMEIAHEYLDGFKGSGIDTLVLGCTHFPVLARPIASVMGDGVKLISSAEETARDVQETLGRRGQLASANAAGGWRFATTSSDVGEFARLASRITGIAIDDVEQVSLNCLEGFCGA